MPCIHLRRVIYGSSREMLAELDLDLDETAPEWLATLPLPDYGRVDRNSGTIHYDDYATSVVLAINVILGFNQPVARKHTEQRNSVSNEHSEGLIQRLIITTYTWWTPLAASFEMISVGDPVICSITPPCTADRSRGRLLRTTTRLSPYGQAGKATTVSNELRPITIVSTLAMNSS